MNFIRTKRVTLNMELYISFLILFVFSVYVLFQNKKEYYGGFDIEFDSMTQVSSLCNL